MRTLGGGAVVSAALCMMLSGCSLLGDGHTSNAAATSTTTASHSPSTPSSYTPLAGPSEAASALPKTCDQMLGNAALQAVFGAGLPIGDNYGSYAAQSSIGRTGRVACVYGVGLNSFGQQSSGSLEVSISTYNSATTAVGRAADTVQADSDAGATTAEVSVGGHPATIVVEQTAVGSTIGSTTGTAPATTSSASPSPSSSPSPTSASPPLSPSASSPSPTAPDGETELVMADGNRTFVLQIPFTKLSAQQAVTALTKLALEVYQNTLPGAAGSGG